MNNLEQAMAMRSLSSLAEDRRIAILTNDNYKRSHVEEIAHDYIEVVCDTEEEKEQLWNYYNSKK